MIRSKIALMLAASALGTAMVAADAKAPAKAGRGEGATLLPRDGYFLSGVNPLANADQRALEERAIRILNSPTVRQGQKQMAQRWRTIVGRDITPEAESRFGELVEEFAFNYVAKAVNGDPNYPKVFANIYAPPHKWMGLDVPGSRASGGDGPDNIYSFIPIDYGARYELHVTRLDPAPADMPYTLTGSLGFTMTLGSLDGRTLRASPDGTYTITIDPDPANGRPNHIQTKPNARYLFIRESRSDWRQRPAAHRIVRLDAPTRPPLTDQQIAEQAVQFMNEDVAAMYWFMRTFAGLEPNVMNPPFRTGSIGGLVSQQISFARIHLADDEAFVATIGSGDAPFRDFVLHDFWFRTIDYAHHTSSMNNSQGIPNADGSTTYIVSLKDPGYHNWLDPVGLHELLIVNRWQGLAADAAPTATGRVVKLRDLASALPPGMKTVTPAERKAQLAEREATYNLRFADQ